MDRATLRWICVIAGLVLAVGPGLDWVPPSSVVALSLALAL